MVTLIVETKNSEELKLILALLKKMGVKFTLLSSEQEKTITNPLFRVS